MFFSLFCVLVCCCFQGFRAASFEDTVDDYPGAPSINDSLEHISPQYPATDIEDMIWDAKLLWCRFKQFLFHERDNSRVVWDYEATNEDLFGIGEIKEDDE